MIEHFAGQDLAKRRDYSALVVLQCINNEILKLVFLKEWDHVDYKTVISDTKRYFGSFYWTRLGVDRSGIGDSVIEEYAYENAEGIVFTQKAKEEMIEHIILLRQQGRLILPLRGAEKLIQQIEEQERIISDAGTVKFRHPSSGHDDLLWAIALACHVAKQEMEKPLPMVATYSMYDDLAPNSFPAAVENTLQRLGSTGFTITSIKTSMPKGGENI
jgi:hypothetical protein